VSEAKDSGIRSAARTDWLDLREFIAANSIASHERKDKPYRPTTDLFDRWHEVRDDHTREPCEALTIRMMRLVDGDRDDILLFQKKADTSSSKSSKTTSHLGARQRALHYGNIERSSLRNSPLRDDPSPVHDVLP